MRCPAVFFLILEHFFGSVLGRFLKIKRKIRAFIFFCCFFLILKRKPMGSRVGFFLINVKILEAERERSENFRDPKSARLENVERLR